MTEEEGTSKDTRITTNLQNFQPLNPWSLSLHTRLLDKMRKSTPSSSGCRILVLRDVLRLMITFVGQVSKRLSKLINCWDYFAF